MSVRTQPPVAAGAPSHTSTIPWKCYRRRDHTWSRFALALFGLGYKPARMRAGGNDDVWGSLAVAE